LVYRRAKAADWDRVFAWAAALSKQFPRLVLDREKVRRLFTEAISGTANFAEVAEEEGQVRACLIALTGANAWAERRFAAIHLWVSEAPGAGRALLCRFAAWVRSRPAIRVAGLTPETDFPLAFYRVLIRAGFSRHGGSYLLFN
jgi:hypothetical protein